MAILSFSHTGSGTHTGSLAANAGTISDDKYYNQLMKHTNAGLEEARRLAGQAKSQVDTQREKIAWMKLSGLSTDTAEEALRTMFKIRDQTIARLKHMTEPAKGD